MDMITLYLDMDGVLADFNKEYTKLDPKKEDRKKFRWSVMEHKIFEKLDFMPDTQELLNHVEKLVGVDVQILTSMGTHEPEQAAEAKRQKLLWLAEKGIACKANFVHNKEEKAKYATPTSILIDDSAGCIGPFIAAGGHGILHTNSSETIRILDATFRQIMILHYLNKNA
jgi:phosphoglycolate phosphatase-like HAD superfamily hydrolase